MGIFAKQPPKPRLTTHVGPIVPVVLGNLRTAVPSKESSGK